MKPLFIPLKSAYFAAFWSGEKTVEYRRRGPRWNADTCWIGRPVVLSRGYGKTPRLLATIIGFHYDTVPNKLPGWKECYGENAGDAACIELRVNSVCIFK